MKKLLYFIGLGLFVISATGCKEHNEKGEDVGAGNQNTENYGNEQGKSDVTETGQHIGSNRDSTSMHGEPGKVSNY